MLVVLPPTANPALDPSAVAIHLGANNLVAGPVLLVRSVGGLRHCRNCGNLGGPNIIGDNSDGAGALGAIQRNVHAVVEVIHARGCRIHRYRRRVVVEPVCTTPETSTSESVQS